jgi:hypothetical protein
LGGGSGDQQEEVGGMRGYWAIFVYIHIYENAIMSPLFYIIQAKNNKKEKITGLDIAHF